MSYSPPHPDMQSLKRPLLWSLAFHMLLFGSLAVSTFLSHRGDMWGSFGGDNAVSVGLVSHLPAIPLPRPETVTTNRVVDTSKGLYQTPKMPKPTPKEVETKSVPIPKFAKDKRPHYITRLSKVLKQPTPPPQNTVPYGGGGAPALPYSSFAMSSNTKTQGGMAFSGKGGGDFSGRFPAYVDAVRNRISSNWLQSTVDPTIAWAPRAIYSFEILRNGTVTNVQLTQSSGNRPVDDSALRAILSSSPLSPLPSAYAGNNVTVEFWFDFRR